MAANIQYPIRSLCTLRYLPYLLKLLVTRSLFTVNDDPIRDMERCNRADFRCCESNPLPTFDHAGKTGGLQHRFEEYEEDGQASINVNQSRKNDQ